MTLDDGILTVEYELYFYVNEDPSILQETEELSITENNNSTNSTTDPDLEPEPGTEIDSTADGGTLNTTDTAGNE